MDLNLIDTRKARARAWFETLREEIVAAFEKLEDALPAAANLPPTIRAFSPAAFR